MAICKTGPQLTHLLFADNSLIFYKSLENECQALLEVLAKYERASGKMINRTKTTLFFSKSTYHDMQLLIKDAIGVHMVQHYEKYLGLPSFIGRKKKDNFANIKQWIWKTLQGWEAKLLT